MGIIAYTIGLLALHSEKILPYLCSTIMSKAYPIHVCEYFELHSKCHIVHFKLSPEIVKMMRVNHSWTCDGIYHRHLHDETVFHFAFCVFLSSFWLYRPLVEEFNPCRNVTTYYPGIVFFMYIKYVFNWHIYIYIYIYTHTARECNQLNVFRLSVHDTSACSIKKKFNCLLKGERNEINLVHVWFMYSL